MGRSSRSNPATYSKAYDGIRKLFAQEGEKVDKQIKPSDFSFNVDGGRCEECLGEGVKKIEMQFMADDIQFNTMGLMNQNVATVAPSTHMSSLAHTNAQNTY